LTGQPEKEGGRRITEKARAARAEALRRARDNPVPKETIGVFVTRIPGGNLYGWEIRQFGGVVIEKGQGSFATSAEAQADGERALAGRFPGTSGVPVP
jgi:hypothetical protein